MLGFDIDKCSKLWNCIKISLSVSYSKYLTFMHKIRNFIIFINYFKKNLLNILNYNYYQKLFNPFVIAS